MGNHTSLLLFVITLVLSCPSSAQVNLSESLIINLAQKNSPTTQAIEARAQMQSAQSMGTRSQYDAKISSEYTYASSREQAIIQFVPVFQPQKLFNLGLSQKTSVGTTITAGMFSQQISTGDGFINNATQVGVQVGLEVDIWKNFLGRLDRSQLRSASTAKKISELQAKIDKRSFVLDVRKAYWSLVANELSLNLANKLVKTAEQQLKESKRKRRDGLADSGDIARNQAQLQSRETSALFFALQKEQILSQLRALLPEINDKEFKVDLSQVPTMEALGRKCMGEISKQSQLNLKQTSFDEVISLLDQQKQDDLRVANATDSIDLKLKGKYQASGVDDSHSRAFDQLNDRFLNGYEVGLAVKIPLGGDLGKSRQAQVTATESQFESQKNQLMLQFQSEFRRAKRSVDLLTQASRSQNKGVESLTQSLKQTRRKYRQARIPLNTYILEQDNLFNSQLQLIDTKRQTLHLLLDFFKVFSHYDCEINAAQGQMI